MVFSRIGVGSLAKVAACLYASIGLIVGVSTFLVWPFGVGRPGGGDSGVAAWMAPVFGLGAVIIVPLLYGGLRAIALSVVAMLYNFAARTVGGVQIEVDRPL